VEKLNWCTPWGCFAMSSMSALKGAGCMPITTPGWTSAWSCSRMSPAARRQYDVTISGDNKYFTRQSSCSFGQKQSIWKAGPKARRNSRHSTRVSAMAAMPQLLPVTSTLGVWAALNFAAATGLWSERTRHASSLMCILHTALYACPCLQHQDVWGNMSHMSGATAVHLRCARAELNFILLMCRVGKELSGPLVSTLVGLLFANAGLVSGSNAPAVYDTVNKFILPLAIPLLLFSADLRYNSSAWQRTSLCQRI